MVEYLTKKQLVDLRERARALRDYLLIETQYETGCTVSELVNIKKTDLKHNAITISGRHCIVSKSLLEQLRSLSQTQTSFYVFASRQSDQLTEKRVQQIVKKLLKQLAVPVEKPTPHILRYTHIAHALEKSIPLSAIKAQTGLGDLRLSQLVNELGPDEDNAYGRMFV